MREIINTVKSEPKVLLEVEKHGKRLKFQVSKIETQWQSKGVSFRYTTTDSNEYEILWSNVGEDRWGRTTLLYNNGKRMSYSAAIRKFFEATEAVEHLTFSAI